MKKLTLLICVLCLAAVSTTKAQNLDRYEEQIYVDGSDTLLYRIAYPENFNPKKRYPVILFLHGAGERGNDNQKQLTHGGELLVSDAVRKDYPAIVVFPQCPNSEMWTARTKRRDEAKREWKFRFPLDNTPPTSARLVNSLMDSLISQRYVNDRRVYIMGISMGGIGTLDFLYRWKDKYAAAVVICGGHNPDGAVEYSDTPIWFFHGAKDDVVPPHYSQEVYDIVKSGNRATRYTLYPEANHNSWDPALGEEDLLKWTFKQRNRR